MPPLLLRNCYVSGSLKEGPACKCDDQTKVNIWVQIAILKRLNSELVWGKTRHFVGSTASGWYLSVREPAVGHASRKLALNPPFAIELDTP